MVENGAENQAATQGIVGQGLLWASEIDGTDYTGTTEEVIGYMTDALWDEGVGTFMPSEGAETYTVTARDIGDITGGLNAAGHVLGMSEAEKLYATHFDNTVRGGISQRAERPASRNGDFENT